MGTRTVARGECAASSSSTVVVVVKQRRGIICSTCRCFNFKCKCSTNHPAPKLKPHKKYKPRRSWLYEGKGDNEPEQAKPTTRPLPPWPTHWGPGSRKRVSVMQWRWKNGYQIHHPNDSTISDGAEKGQVAREKMMKEGNNGPDN